MTAKRNPFALWAGIGGGVLVVGLTVVWWRNETLAANAAKANSLHQQYLSIYHPDQPQGFAVEDARRELAAVSGSQDDELASVERALAPALPDAYIKTDLADAQDTVKSDIAALQHLAERTRIPVPGSLPFQGGLDPDAKNRALQLVQSHLCRMTLESCLHAGVSKVTNLTPGPAGQADPSGSYALFTCDVQIESSWDALSRVLSALTTPDGRGLGLRNLRIDSDPEAKQQKVTITACCLVPNRPEWNLGAAPSAGPASGQPAKAAEPGRLRRLGARP